MRAHILIILFTCLFTQMGLAQSIDKPEELVNVLMGTDSNKDFSNGNTYPAIALPWGMNFWSPQTGSNANGWQYQYNSTKIRGFKQTHQPSPWIGDYGQFALFPSTGKLIFNEEKRASQFSHKAEIAKPYFYQVYLSDHDVLTKITPTDRAALFSFQFPKADSSWILIDAYDRGSYVKIIPEQRKIIGYTTRNRGGVPANFKNYFVVYFDKDFKFSAISQDSLRNKGLEISGFHAQAAVGFKTKKGDIVHARVASSFISFEQAELNLSREIGNQSFDQIQSKAQAVWHKELSKIKVEGGSLDQMRTFYSCYYRMILFPRKFYEFDAANQMVHYSPYNGNIEKGYMFTDTGFWDTFRSLFPFLTIVYPELNGQILKGLENTYKESGWLPEWSSPGHKKSMIGSNSASVIADGFLKGAKGFDANVLYEGMLKNSENESKLGATGRVGVKGYNELGYVPGNEYVGSAARTLEYAYDDFCVSEMAKKLGRPQSEIELFQKRAQNYKNIFDPHLNLMRRRNRDGSFQANFNPFSWGNEFVEGNSWHYSWSVFHDFRGLAKLMGGKKSFESMLDSVFKLPPTVEFSGYNGIIHEMTEMQVMNMGQYAHGNQPIQHMLYLYNYCDAPWKTQFHVRDALDKLYKPTPDGYCGDEDNGQTSAWYVLSAMGFYSVTPGTQEYVLGSPLFKKVTIELPNQKKFILQAPSNSPEHVYIQDLKWNGKTWNKNYILHKQIQEGGSFTFTMSNKANKRRGIGVTAEPFSMTKAQ